MDIKNLLLTEHKKNVDKILIRLHELYSITFTLHENETTLRLARKLLDGVITKFESLKDRLANNATIVNNVYFKSAIFKIQSGNEHSLSIAKERTLQHLRGATSSVPEKKR